MRSRRTARCRRLVLALLVILAPGLTSCGWLLNEAFVYDVAPPAPPTLEDFALTQQS